MDGSFPTTSKANIAKRLTPRQPAPALRFLLLGGGIFDLSAKTPQSFSTKTMPFARPHFAEMIQAFDLVQRVEYPARGGV
jgi:hypothetical protein